VGGEACAQVTGLAHVDQPVAILRGFPEEEVDPHLTALLHRQEISQQAAGHLDHLDDAGGDLGDANAVGVAAGQEDLDCFGGAAHAASASDTRPRTSIWPVTAAEIRAERRSWRSNKDLCESATRSS
jgi:hypothetical protein